MQQASYQKSDGTTVRRWRVKTSRGEMVTWAQSKTEVRVKCLSRKLEVLSIEPAASIVNDVIPGLVE